MKRRRFAGVFGPYLAAENDQERVASTLDFFLRTLIAVSAVVAIISAVAGYRMAIILSSVGGVIMVLLLLLMRRGHPRAAGFLLTLTWLVITIVALATGEGIHDIATIIFPAVLIFASLLLSRRLYVVVAVLAVVAGALIGIAEVLGIVDTPFSRLDWWGDVANFAVILACIAILVHFLTEALRLSLDRAQRSEQRFRGVFNAAREAIIIHEAETGEIVDVNASFLTTTGLDRDHAIGLPPELVYGDAVDWEQIRTPGASLPEVVECDLAVQTMVSPRIEVTFRPSSIGGRNLVLAVARDITARRRLEDRLRQSEKMHAVGELAGGIAHDFNNQLVGIVGYADLLRVKLADQPELAAYAERILGSARRASDLTAHLLAFARKGKFRTMEVDLHEIIGEVVALLERSIDKQIVIRLDLAASPATTLGDPSQIQNCFLNLALNARDAMPNGGELSFTTAIVELDEDFCRSSPNSVSAGRFVEINVTDTGEGMSRRIVERIFEPFFTTKDKEKGTGMGLAAVYGTVKNHKGTVSVYSEEGRGTNFRMHLPLFAETEADSSERVETTPVMSRVDAHILLVDDEELVCETTSNLLRTLGYRVTVCRNGREAVEAVRGDGPKIDLVILDMIMPVMGGGATLEALKEIAPEVRVLVSSGYSLDGETQKVLDLGAVGFVQKPFLMTELAGAVRQALAGGN